MYAHNMHVINVYIQWFLPGLWHSGQRVQRGAKMLTGRHLCHVMVKAVIQARLLIMYVCNLEQLNSE